MPDIDINQERKALCARFGLFDGQFFASNRYKNLQWFLNGMAIGYGDLTTDQIVNIQRELSDGERFVGHSEHWGTRFQTSKHPRVIITPDRIYHAQEIHRHGMTA